MNFFGHFVVAQAFNPSLPFGFGAMLPDLLPMAGVHHEDVADSLLTEPSVRAGVQFHHQTDAVFHANPEFTALNRLGRRDLAELGVRRGPALAASHVGIELLLDGALADRRDIVDQFTEALLALGKGAPSSGPAGPRLRKLCTRLVGAGVPSSYGSPAFSAARIVGALHARPRLATNPAEAANIEGWLAGVQGQVVASAGSIVERVLAGLTDV